MLLQKLFWLLLLPLVSFPRYAYSFGRHFMEVAEADRAQIVCTMALLHKYFHYGEPLSGALISMSFTTASLNIQEDLLNAMHAQLGVPWTVVVRNLHQPFTSSRATAMILHEKPQCYFVIIENLQDGDLEDVFEDWETDINWNPLAQFVVFLASIEETDEEMSELMSDILLTFMNKNIYNVNVIGRNYENGFFYGKTVFPYHPDNNCGNRVIAIETLDICDFPDDSKNVDGDDDEDYNSGEEDGDEVNVFKSGDSGQDGNGSLGGNDSNGEETDSGREEYGQKGSDEAGKESEVENEGNDRHEEGVESEGVTEDKKEGEDDEQVEVEDEHRENEERNNEGNMEGASESNENEDVVEVNIENSVKAKRDTESEVQKAVGREKREAERETENACHEKHREKLTMRRSHKNEKRIKSDGKSDQYGRGEEFESEVENKDGNENDSHNDFDDDDDNGGGGGNYHDGGNDVGKDDDDVDDGDDDDVDDDYDDDGDDANDDGDNNDGGSSHKVDDYNEDDGDGGADDDDDGGDGNDNDDDNDGGSSDNEGGNDDDDNSDNDADSDVDDGDGNGDGRADDGDNIDNNSINSEVGSAAKSENEFEIGGSDDSEGRKYKGEESYKGGKAKYLKRVEIKKQGCHKSNNILNKKGSKKKYTHLRSEKLRKKTANHIPNKKCDKNDMPDIKVEVYHNTKDYTTEGENGGGKAYPKLAAEKNRNGGCGHGVSQKYIIDTDNIKEVEVKSQQNKNTKNEIYGQKRGTNSGINNGQICRKTREAHRLVSVQKHDTSRFQSNKTPARSKISFPLKNCRMHNKRAAPKNVNAANELFTQEIYVQELYRGQFLDKFPKDLSGCAVAAAYRPWEPYIFKEGKVKSNSVNDYPIVVESNEESGTDVEVYEAKESEESGQKESESVDYDYGETNRDSYISTETDVDTDTDANSYDDVRVDAVGAGDGAAMKWNGIEYQLIRTIGKLLNITIDLQVENSNLYLLFQQLIDGDIEMILGGIDEDPSLNHDVSSSIAYYQDDLTWCVAKAKRNYSLFNFLQSFHISTWIFTSVFILLTSLHVFLTQKLLRIRLTHFGGFFVTFMRIFGIVLNQSTSLTHLPHSLCITFGSTFLLALMFINSYQSFLVSTLTTPQSAYQISHLDEIFRNRMTVTGSAENVRHLSKDGETYKYIRENFQMCYNIEECLNRAATDEHIAVAVSRQHSFYNPRILRDQLHCFDRNENIYVYLVTVLFPKKYHLLHKINPIIQHVIESGHMQKWARELDLKRKIHEEMKRGQKELVKGLSLNEVAGSFALHGMLAALASAIFLLERWTHWMVVKRRTRMRLVKMLHRQFS